MSVGPVSIVKAVAAAALVLLAATPSSSHMPPAGIQPATAHGGDSRGLRLVCRRYFGCVPLTLPLSRKEAP